MITDLENALAAFLNARLALPEYAEITAEARSSVSAEEFPGHGALLTCNVVSCPRIAGRLYTATVRIICDHPGDSDEFGPDHLAAVERFVQDSFTPATAADLDAKIQGVTDGKYKSGGFSDDGWQPGLEATHWTPFFALDPLGIVKIAA